MKINNSSTDIDAPRTALSPIPFALPFIGKEEEEAVIRVLRSQWLTTGAETLAFETEFAAFVGGGVAALAVSSATAGLHLALEACGVGPGDVVLVPSYTFAATAEVARYLGADVAFVDVRRGTFHMDPLLLEKTAERLDRGLPAYESGGPKGRPRAVMPVHFGGLPCDMDAVMAAAKKYGMYVVEDAAHSFPAWYKNRHAGTIGDIGVFSFYATKTITTGEGGMVVSRNAALLERMRIMRLHGIDRPVWNRYTGEKASWYYAVTDTGYKYNLPDILAAIGRVQLGRTAALLARRRSIAARYDAAFGADERFIIPPTVPDTAADARHLYPLRLSPGIGGTVPDTSFRDAFIKKLQSDGIGVSVHFIPLHTMPYYKRRYGLHDGDFPHSLESFRQEISLPIWPGMKDEQVERVIKRVQSIGCG
jgi:dTDP-4-amino-4,6-dideoxygalactose transaminase